MEMVYKKHRKYPVYHYYVCVLGYLLYMNPLNRILHVFLYMYSNMCCVRRILGEPLLDSRLKFGTNELKGLLRQQGQMTLYRSS